MTSPVQHGEGRARVLVEQLPGPGVADRGVLASGHQQGRASVWSLVPGPCSELPPLTDACHCGLVGAPGSRFDVPLVALQSLLCLDREVVTEVGVADRARAVADFVF